MKRQRDVQTHLAAQISFLFVGKRVELRFPVRWVWPVGKKSADIIIDARIWQVNSRQNSLRFPRNKLKYFVIKGRLLKTREAILVLTGKKMKKETKGKKNERGGKKQKMKRGK